MRERCHRDPIAALGEAIEALRTQHDLHGQLGWDVPAGTRQIADPPLKRDAEGEGKRVGWGNVENCYAAGTSTPCSAADASR